MYKRVLLTLRSYSSQKKEGDYYELLGLNRNATLAEIKSAYYKMSKLYHPDMNVDDEKAARAFHRIQEAYEVLSNVETRKRYDRGLLRPLDERQDNVAPRYGKPVTRRSGVFEWQEEDYTSFYRRKREQQGTTQFKPAHFKPPKKQDYGSYFRVEYGSTIKRVMADEKKSKSSESKESIKSSYGSNFIFVILIFGLILGVLISEDYDISVSKEEEPKRKS